MSRVPGIDLSGPMPELVIWNVEHSPRPIHNRLRTFRLDNREVSFVHRNTPGCIPVTITFPDGSRLEGWMSRQDGVYLADWAHRTGDVSAVTLNASVPDTDTVLYTDAQELNLLVPILLDVP